MSASMRILALLIFGYLVLGPFGLLMVTLMWIGIQMFTTGRISK